MNLIPKPEAIQVPRSRGAYLSPEMVARRKRITRAAKEIMEESGETSLTIKRLCERAGVAARTIYRGFGDRDGVIMAAVADHMESISLSLSKAPRARTLQAVFDEYDWIADELFRGPEFARILIRYYFTQGTPDDEIAALRSVPRARILAWLDASAQNQILVAGLDHSRIADFQVETEYAVFHQWASGRIADDRVGDALKANFLFTAAAVTAEPSRSEILAHLARFQG